MLTSSHKRNTEGITLYREKKKKACIERVENAITELIRNHQAINFNIVSESANVSKKYLYDYYYERINELRAKQEGIKPKQVKQQMTNNSKDILLAAKNKRIKELEEEIVRLKAITQRKYSEEYNKI